MTLEATDRRRVRRGAVKVAAGVAGAALVCSAAGLQAQATESGTAAEPDQRSGEFRIAADGYYATAQVRTGAEAPLPVEVPELDAHVTVGQIESEANSAGVEGEDEGVFSRAFGIIASVGGAGAEFDVPYLVEQVALPEEADTATYGLHGLEVPILGNLDAISGEVKANWNDDLVTEGGAGGVLTSLYSGVGEVDLIDIADLGGVADMLPIELPAGSPVVTVGAGQLLQETGTFPKDDGSLGAYAEVSGRFADLSVLGGAANGGISLGLAGSDDGETPNAWGRLAATGEPGGAAFDYELPALELHVGDNDVIHVEPGFDETFDLGGLSVNLNFADYRDSDTVLAEDGTVASASGGGLSVRVTVTVPVPVVGDVEVASAEVGLLSFPELSVEVPQGGITGEAVPADAARSL
ncbi:hypothetical protein [Jiangella alkaliphila]|uniref:Uncharacterized protein n=1 Tax=Jiangella alkaliphila TaxID=419479 RepID=A0A1H2FTH3_9ACTN|nr:hypothetical protein [Jiangella alkaliphila]SDU10653.1 hypothetical protein SAMN04488563_0112 [Jiangella alkaliphila]